MAVGVGFIDGKGFTLSGKVDGLAPIALVVSVAVGAYFGSVECARSETFLNGEGVAVGIDEVGFVAVEANLPGVLS